MKLLRYVYVVVIVVSAASCASTHLREEYNSFAEGDLLVGIPVGWRGTSRGPEDIKVGVDREIAHGGDVSLTFLSRRSGEDMTTTFRQVIKAGKFAGKRVRFQAYLRTYKVMDSSGLFMWADSETRGAVVLDNMYKRRISGTTDWQLYTIVLDIPKEAVAIFYGVELWGSGQVWIDDCSIEIVSDDVRANRLLGAGLSRKFVAPAGILNYPANLGFEGRPENN